MDAGAADGPALRRFFDKVMRDEAASFSPRDDGPRFMQAVLQYDDKVDLLFRLMSPKVSGGEGAASTPTPTQTRPARAPRQANTCWAGHCVVPVPTSMAFPGPVVQLAPPVMVCSSTSCLAPPTPLG